MFKYQVGDQVTIRHALRIGNNYDGGCLFTREMACYKGRKATIERVSDYGGNPRYRLDIDRGTWGWTDTMLKPFEEKTKTKPIRRKELLDLLDIK